MLRAWRSKRGSLTTAAILTGVFLVWLARHISTLLTSNVAFNDLRFYWVYLGTFLLLAATMVLAHFDKPKGDRSAPDDKYVVAIVPAYNEDEDVLKDCLQSFLHQTRKPNEVHVIDDGSTTSDYASVKEWFVKAAALQGVEAVWKRTKNGGKRHAQAQAIAVTPHASIYVTVDSDSVLDRSALYELLLPFSDESVQSVAGVVLARNNTKNILARITDLLFVTGQLIDRSAMSTLGSVLVNSGGLAAYRASVVRCNFTAYLHESFFGKHIEFSDDSMLTLYALHQGKTVQQPTAYVFTMMPENIKHHIRQQVRWSKGSFIRSWWRLKYLPILSFGFMRQLSGWLQFTLTSTMAFVILVVHPLQTNVLYIGMLLMPIVVGYAKALRYITVRRSDQSFVSQLVTYAMAPLAVLWAYFVLRPVRWYAMATCLRTGWGTRKKVEVSMSPQVVQAVQASPFLRGGYTKNMAYHVAHRSYVAYATYRYKQYMVRMAHMNIQEAEAFWLETYRTMSARQKRNVWRYFRMVYACMPPQQKATNAALHTTNQAVAWHYYAAGQHA